MTRKRGNLRWWIATVMGGVGVCLGVALGCWQLDRAAQKTELFESMQARSAAPVLDAGAVRESLSQGEDVWSALLHRPVQLQGRWLAEHTVYLDNRQMNGRTGFYVFTPLQLSQGDVVLVQRGWLARNFQDRTALPPLETPSGPVQVNARLAGAPGRVYALGRDMVEQNAQPDIRQNLDMDAFSQQSGLTLWPLTVVQTDADSEGLLRNWPQVNSGVATHHGYAFQWFAIATVLAGMLLWFQFLKPARRKQERNAT